MEPASSDPSPNAASDSIPPTQAQVPAQFHHRSILLEGGMELMVPVMPLCQEVPILLWDSHLVVCSFHAFLLVKVSGYLESHRSISLLTSSHRQKPVGSMLPPDFTDQRGWHEIRTTSSHKYIW
jgi:hypothetical protein